ncbi:protein bric-a-brac 1-like isoform X3 [Scylla paramamosain]|uniref:protein bric-a-brac 1-like isoform X3 n=1 Tax=Scylla paramamosain TaxID=85552 RepID=UPI003083A6D0
MEDSGGMTTNAQEFCLRWNNFHSSLVTALDGFKNDQDFVDVTLACEGQFLKAHKMLLSACSVFFRDLLKANPCQHPIVILPPEVRFADLEKLLRFIYQGEVNVHQENLARFLKTAEMLKIRGLAEDSEKQRVLRSSSPRPPESCEADSVSPKRPRLSIDVHQPCQEPRTPNDDSRLSGGDSDSEMIPVKQEMVELKESADPSYEGGDNEAFVPEAYMREGGSGSSSQQSQQQAPPNAPPPPGPLLPSYVPPPQVKTQDDSPLGPTAPDELSQGTFARLVADHMGAAGGAQRPPGQGRSPSTSRSPGQGISPGLMRSPGSPGGIPAGIPGGVPGGIRAKPVTPHLPQGKAAVLRSPGAGRSPSPSLSQSLTPSPLSTFLPGFTPPSTNPATTPTSTTTSTRNAVGVGGVVVGAAVGTPPSSSPIVCDICHKTFTSRSNLNKHKRVQHSGEEYVCPICRRTFRNRYYIKEHVLLCSTASQKKANAAAAAAAMLGDGSKGEEGDSGGGGGGGGGEEQPTDLVLRRTASPT